MIRDLKLWLFPLLGLIPLLTGCRYFHNYDEDIMWDRFDSLSPCEKVVYFDSVSRSWHEHGNYPLRISTKLIGTLETITNTISLAEKDFGGAYYADTSTLSKDVTMWSTVLNCHR